jgi:hypothetical protein
VDIRAEIAARVDALTPEMQEQVLRFVSSLASAPPKGEPGVALRRFARLLDRESAQEMREAIEEGCERVDASEW